ncbi:MAG: bifunctional demethylmenaquinone methyltransferase/2-methoxy-6-polyprenyl-1,4-benzoquinol methylase UbiE [Muribaculaceae bacterium]|nr:bifunctional demethylmenaquinone methyltransferase/2-methoxy-6-polyprenyl-1,4-benzoquinol methylase UbiE [Muribaculaceae bacterium]MDE6131246.1 bifunctional demethylmenaquinone methyltransferase/2-methoxy-6-polyprenyl-1,4-benzoquinol methylase UbiE [Muribaculaceae bacterium]
MEVKAEKINPYEGDSRAKTEQVRQMFDSISGAYDFMNRAMTMGVDRLWRRKAVSTVRHRHPRLVVDLATGTGDLAIALARRIPETAVTGYDLSEGMLDVGRKKVEKAGLSDRISLHQADCLALPAEDSSADVVTVAYGVRNFEHLLEGYREMHRILRPGGMLCVLELSTPRGRLTGPLYQFYTRRIIPALGRLVSNDDRAYSYLPESIAAVPQGPDMCALMAEAGFSDCSFRPMTFGACTMYTAVK